SELEALKAKQRGSSGDQDGDSANSNREEERQTLLAQILDRDARERLGRIALVKKELARHVEDMLIQMARMNKIRNKVTEDELKDLLEQISTKNSQETKIIVSRKEFDDSDEEE
ncbi:PDCD5-related protein, partial [Coemansia spiralis]